MKHSKAKTIKKAVTQRTMFKDMNAVYLWAEGVLATDQASDVFESIANMLEGYASHAHTFSPADRLAIIRFFEGVANA